MTDHKLHHNDHNFQRGIVEDDWGFEDLSELDTAMQDESLDEQPEYMGANNAKVRKRIDEYLERRRMKDIDADPFDEDSY